MRTIKPQRLAFLHRTYEREAKIFFAPTVLAFFDLAAPDSLLPEVVMWQAVGEHLGPGVVLDEGIPKVRGEVLITGFAWGSDPEAGFVDCSVILGSVRKTVRVFGNRHWDSMGRITKPSAVERIPIDHAHAFGGSGFARNPLGVGAGYPETVELPNVENPLALITDPKERPEPTGFDSIPVDWPQRTRFHGTFDAKWQEERFPGYPDDHDWTYFNLAPADQWLDGFFEGGEEVTLVGMHPSQATIRGKLPNICARVFVEPADESTAREVPMRFETVRLYPHLMRGVAIFRGATQVADDQARDLNRVLVAADDKAAPRPPAHYLDLLERRRASDVALLESLDEAPLLPVGGPTRVDHTTETHHGAWVVPRELLLQQNMRKGAEIRLETARAQLIEAGLDPDEHGLPKELPPPEPVPAVDKLVDHVRDVRTQRDEMVQQAEERQAQVDKDMRALCEEQGLDYDQMRQDAQDASGGPPDFSADAKIANLLEQATLLDNIGQGGADLRAMASDPALRKKLEEAEKALLDAYRRSAHRMPPAPHASSDATRAARRLIAERRRTDQPCDDHDFTGADLTGVDFSGMSLQRALFDNAILVGCSFRSSDLSGAVLSRCDLTNAQFDDAKLVDANFGSATLTGASLSKADLSGATLTGATLTDARFDGSNMTRADLSEAIFENTSLERATLDSCLLTRSDLRGSIMKAVHMNKAVLYDCDLSGVDFSGATLDEACFVTVTAKKAQFDHAHLHSFRVLKDSNLEGSHFVGASMVGANFRGTALADANFTGCDLTRADLSECTLTGADLSNTMGRESRFERSILRNAKLVSADLLDAMLPHAEVHGADFTGANLFRSDFARVTGDDSTVFDGANTRFVRIVKGTVDVPG